MLEAMEFEKKIGIEVFLTDTKGLGGKLKETAHDFIVDPGPKGPDVFIRTGRMNAIGQQNDGDAPLDIRPK